MNTLYYGDNLVWLRDKKYFPDEFVDLIYLDPPFNSKADYNLLFKEPNSDDKSQAQIKAFDDTWHWDSEASEIALNELAKNMPQIAEFIYWLSHQGKSYQSMSAYLSMISVRLMELHRILKYTGSLYLHCDPTASHYLKIILDQIFGEKCFRNEIVWHYSGWNKIMKSNFESRHDVIFFYSKSDNFTFNSYSVPWSNPEEYVKKRKQKLLYDKNGRPYVLSDAGGGQRVERYIDDAMKYGIPVDDVWDIDKLNNSSKERLGYPTQKPCALLERIISASSNEGDIVLDPFCGCGTTIDAAQKLNRQWLGIDVTWLAIDLVEKRLKQAHKEKITGTYQIKGNPIDLSDARALAKKSKKEFEIWAISLVGAHPREHDGGVDGIFGFVEKDRKPRTIIVQVKGGETLAPTIVRDLRGTLENENAAIALLITLVEPTSGMREFAVHSPRYISELWGKEYPCIQIRTIEELLNGNEFDLPPMIDPFKKAQTARELGNQLTL